MRDLYNFQIGFRAAIYRLYRYSTPVGALMFICCCQDDNLSRKLEVTDNLVAICPLLKDVLFLA